jgi:AGCS family alanine or glycine:cation symporter
MIAFFQMLNGWVWGPAMLMLLLGTGIYFTVMLRGIQFRYLPLAFKMAFGKQETDAAGDISHFQSLMTALAATLGTGNIAGVAMALMVGGVGSLFWMWVTAIIGMTLKYAEALLAVKYRTLDKNGEMAGGPMYFIEKGLGWRWLAVAFAIFGILVSLGGGNMVQANTVAMVMQSVFAIDPFWTGLVMALLIGASILGGIKSIGRVASFLVPFMALLYVLGGVFILGTHLSSVPGAFWSIFQHAFSGQAAFGGFIGASTITAIQVGLSRGLMTSEAGLGTASIAAAAAKTSSPGRQGLVSMTGCILTTLLMCTITALVLLVTDVMGNVDGTGMPLNGAAMTVAAFDSVFTGGGYVVSFSLVMFGFTTILGYAYYAEKCLEYLLGAWSISTYRVLFTGFVLLGAVLRIDLVWVLTDIANGLMAYPNLIGLLALSRVVIRETESFTQQLTGDPALSLAESQS